MATNCRAHGSGVRLWLRLQASECLPAPLSTHLGQIGARPNGISRSEEDDIIGCPLSGLSAVQLHAAPADIQAVVIAESDHGPGPIVRYEICCLLHPVVTFLLFCLCCI